MQFARGNPAEDHAGRQRKNYTGLRSPVGLLRSLIGDHGVRIANLSRIFVFSLVMMAFGIVGISLINVSGGRQVVERWHDVEQLAVIKKSATSRLDLAELVNSYQMFQSKPGVETGQLVSSNIEEIERAIGAYKGIRTSSAETESLKTIARAVESFRTALVVMLSPSGRRELSAQARQKMFDDTYNAIIAVKLLNAEHDFQRDMGFSEMRSSVDDMMSVLNTIAVTSSIVAAVIGALIWWLSNHLLINPLVALRQSMNRLAAGDTGVELRPDEMLTDIREMTSSVEVFRRNLIDAGRLRREEKEAQRQIRILSQAMNQSQSSIVLVDPEKHIRYFNPRFGELLGDEPDDVLGQDFNSVLDLEFEDSDDLDIWREAARSGGWEGELPGRNKAGEKFWHRLVVSPVRENEAGISHYLVAMEDVSGRKEIESLLIEAKETAEVANRAKSEFLTNMTHELRTPLNAVIGFSEILKGEMLGPFNHPRYLEYSNDIFESGKHLLKLIENILDFSKIEVGKHVLAEQDVDLPEAARLCCNIVRDRARHKKITLHLDIPDHPVLLRADGRKVKQIILNLLSNGVKFSHEGKTVIVGIRIEDDQEISLYVQDFGIGISSADIVTALMPFGQVDGKKSREYEGTGLGLSLSNSLVKAHGGTLTIDSEVDVGTTVTVTFPVARYLQPEVLEVEACA